MPTVRGGKVNPSMLDVARHAGVSIATVSNVINRPDKVAPETAYRVRASIDRLGFVRNDAARSLAVGSSRSIGMVIADLDNSVFVDMAQGAQTTAEAEGMRMVLGNSQCDMRTQNDYLDLFDEARVAGLLLAPMYDSSEGIARMRSHGRQIVLLNFAQADVDCCTVLVDNEQVGYLAARHLIESGRTRIAYIAGLDHFQPVRDRRAGVRRAVLEAGPAVTLEEIETRALLWGDGERAADQLLMRRTELVPDGIVAVTDVMANGLIDRLRADGRISVPDDLAVVGCEDNRSAPRGALSLTTVHEPGKEMGEQAVALLLEELQAEPESHTHRTIMMEPALVVRESTVPRHARDLLPVPTS